MDDLPLTMLARQLQVAQQPRPSKSKAKGQSSATFAKTYGKRQQLPVQTNFKHKASDKVEKSDLNGSKHLSPADLYRQRLSLEKEQAFNFIYGGGITSSVSTLENPAQVSRRRKDFPLIQRKRSKDADPLSMT